MLENRLCGLVVTLVVFAGFAVSFFPRPYLSTDFRGRFPIVDFLYGLSLGVFLASEWQSVVFIVAYVAQTALWMAFVWHLLNAGLMGEESSPIAEELARLRC